MKSLKGEGPGGTLCIIMTRDRRRIFIRRLHIDASFFSFFFFSFSLHSTIINLIIAPRYCLVIASLLLFISFTLRFICIIAVCIMMMMIIIIIIVDNTICIYTRIHIVYTLGCNVFIAFPFPYLHHESLYLGTGSHFIARYAAKNKRGMSTVL